MHKRYYTANDSYDLDRFFDEAYPYNSSKSGDTFNCSYGSHKWKWYEGFHMERYWFCEMCDEKDYKRPAPNKKNK